MKKGTIITPDKILDVLKNKQTLTTFEIAEKIIPLSTDSDAQKVYTLLMFKIRDKVIQPEAGKWRLKNE